MTGADSESGTTSAPTNTGIKCSKFPGENIRKVYSKFDGSVVRTLCAECLFQDPEFVQNNKTDLYDVSVYLNKLFQMISHMGGNLDNLRHSVPQHATDFLEKGDSIGELFGQFSLIEFTKLKNLVTMHTDKIVEMVEIMIQG